MTYIFSVYIVKKFMHQRLLHFQQNSLHVRFLPHIFRSQNLILLYPNILKIHRSPYPEIPTSQIHTPDGFVDSSVTFWWLFGDSLVTLWWLWWLFRRCLPWSPVIWEQKLPKVKYIARISYEYDVSKFSDDSFWPSMDYFFAQKLSFTDIICYPTSIKSNSQFPGVLVIFGSF